MDPSPSACLIYDSLKELAPIYTGLDEDRWYRSSVRVELSPQYMLVNTNVGLEAIYIDQTMYRTLNSVKDTYGKIGYKVTRIARDTMNPYEKIGKSIFNNRAAIKLANIDAVHHITNTIFTFMNKKSGGAFTFCDIAAGPGAFTEYLQYRLPNSKGYGITLKGFTEEDQIKFDWNPRILDMTRFTAFYGADGSGNLYTNWEEFVTYVLSKEPDGVDLITGDGGIDAENNQQEWASSRLTLTQALVGIGCARIGGNFVLKLFDTVTSISAHILFILSQCFDRILPFKPVSSRPANSERYLVCMGRKVDVRKYYSLLAGAAKSYQDTKFLSSIFSEPVPEDFTRWLLRENTSSIGNQYAAIRNIMKFLGEQNRLRKSGIEMIPDPKQIDPGFPEYDISKFLLIWSLPDNVPYSR